MSAGPQIELTSGGVLVLLGVVLGGLVLWRASRVASDAAGQAWERASRTGRPPWAAG